MVSTADSRTESRVDWHFLLLGAGFMLLEAQIVSRMALLFGTTRVVNSIVVSGLLLLIVAANLVYQRFPSIPVGFAYVDLLVSLLVSFVVPLEVFVLRVVMGPGHRLHDGALYARVFCRDRLRL